MEMHRSESDCKCDLPSPNTIAFNRFYCKRKCPLASCNDYCNQEETTIFGHDTSRKSVFINYTRKRTHTTHDSFGVTVLG